MNRAPFPLNRATTLIFGLFALASQACTTATTTTTIAQPPGRSAVTSKQLAAAIAGITTPCLNRTLPSPHDTVRAVPQIFVEALLFDVPEGAEFDKRTQRLRSAGSQPDVAFFASPHMIAALDTKATVQLGRTYYPTGSTPAPGLEFAGMTLLPTLGSPDALLLELDFELQMASPAGSASPISSVHLRNTFVTKDRLAASTVAAVPGAPKTSVAIIVVPHLIRSDADLRDHFACKMQRVMRARDAAP